MELGSNTEIQPYDGREAIRQTLENSRSKTELLINSYLLYGGSNFPEINDYKRKLETIKHSLNPQGTDNISFDIATGPNSPWHRANGFMNGATLALGMRFINNPDIPYYNEAADFALHKHFGGKDEIEKTVRLMKAGFTACCNTESIRKFLNGYIAEQALFDRTQNTHMPLPEKIQNMIFAGAGSMGLMLDYARAAHETAQAHEQSEMFDISVEERVDLSTSLERLYLSS